VWDSWAVPETGVLEGNAKYTGHYHECRLAENEGLFSGKWCQAYYGILYQVIEIHSHSKTIKYRVSKNFSG